MIVSTPLISKPRDAKSVAIRKSTDPSRNCFRAPRRCQIDNVNGHKYMTINTDLFLRQITMQFFALHAKQAKNYAHLMCKFLATKKDDNSMFEVLLAQRNNQC